MANDKRKTRTKWVLRMRFNLVVPSARRPSDYEAAAFPPEEEAENWCCAAEIWDDVDVSSDWT